MPRLKQPLAVLSLGEAEGGVETHMMQFVRQDTADEVESPLLTNSVVSGNLLMHAEVEVSKVDDWVTGRESVGEGEAGEPYHRRVSPRGEPPRSGRNVGQVGQGSTGCISYKV